MLLPHRMAVGKSEARSLLVLSSKDLQERLLDLFKLLLNGFLRLLLTSKPANHEQSRYCSSGITLGTGATVLSTESCFRVRPFSRQLL